MFPSRQEEKLQRPRFTRRFVLVAGVSSLATFGTGGAVVFARANDHRKRGWGKDVVRRKVRLAVANGELTREQAAEKLRALRDGHGKRGTKLVGEEIGAKLRVAVQDGRLTREQAAEKLRAWRDGDNKWGRKPTREEMETKLQAMVANGSITQEQADKKLEFTRWKSSEKLSSR